MEHRKELMQIASQLIFASTEFMELDGIDRRYSEDDEPNIISQAHEHMFQSILLVLKIAGLTEDELDDFIDKESEIKI